MKKIILIFSIILFISCEQKTEKLNLLFELPKDLKETSGIFYDSTNNLIWTLEDSGNENEIYALDNDGKILKTIKLNDLKNNDWEDLTQDKQGNLYIGDFGNNDNERKDLAIYKVNASDLQKENVEKTTKISFNYPEQTEFPPNKKELFFDVEGFIEMNNNFYLFTKNRSKKGDGAVFIYKVPNQEGNHEAKKIGDFKTCEDFETCAITSAAISPNGKQIALLTHSKIWVFENFTDDNFTSGKTSIFELNHNTQKESICYKDDQTLLIADEKSKKIGGNVYEIQISDLK